MTDMSLEDCLRLAKEEVERRLARSQAALAESEAANAGLREALERARPHRAAEVIPSHSAMTGYRMLELQLEEVERRIQAALATPASPRVAELVKALAGVLEYERQRAKLVGLSDCTCIDYSRQMESAYEQGKCPHQVARKALAPSPEPEPEVKDD